MSESFDPSKYLSKVGKADYLEVKWRLVWLRDAHPDAIIETECLTSFEQSASFKCTIEIPGGGKATGHGTETMGDFRDFFEKAETKAIGRALGALGFGTQFSAHEFGGEADAGRIVDAPVFVSTGVTGIQATTDIPARTRTEGHNTVPVEVIAYPSGVTKKQIGMIQAVANEKGIPPEEVRKQHGKESATLLTKQEASKLIEWLQSYAVAYAEPEPEGVPF